MARETPLYRRISAAVEDLIQTKGLAPGSRLPAERELCEQHQASSKTVKFALRELELRGIIVRRKGSGTFVAEPVAGNNLVAVLIPGIGVYGYWVHFIAEVERELAARGLTCVLQQVGETVHDLQAGLNRLNGLPIRAVLWCPVLLAKPTDRRRAIAAMERLSAEVVVIDEPVDLPRALTWPFVGEDNRAGGATAAQTLHAHGYDRYCFIACSQSTTTEDRWLGFSEQLKELGVKKSAISRKNTEPNHFPRLINTWVKPSQPRLGVFTHTDSEAVAIINYLQAQDIAIPNRIGVFGFGDIAILPSVGLSTVQHNFKALAKAAVEAAVGERTGSTLIATPLIKRTSA